MIGDSVRAAHADLHLGPGSAAQLADQLVERLAARALAIDRDDAVARTNARALGGRALDGRDDRDGVVVADRPRRPLPPNFPSVSL